jgi:hypothetical protein
VIEGIEVVNCKHCTLGEERRKRKKKEPNEGEIKMALA